MTAGVYTFGTVEYRPLLPSGQLETAIPRAPLAGEWVHVPFGPNRFVTDSSKLHTSWQVSVWLPSDTDKTALLGYEGTFQSLVTPFGTFSALLRTAAGLQRRNDGAWVGPVVWEWA